MRQGHEYIYNEWLTTRVWALCRGDVGNFKMPGATFTCIPTIDLPVPNLFRKKKKITQAWFETGWMLVCKLGILIIFQASHWELGSSPTSHKLTEIWDQRFVAAISYSWNLVPPLWAMLQKQSWSLYYYRALLLTVHLCLNNIMIHAYFRALYCNLHLLPMFL
jgi:hypothetical protein